MFRTVVCAILAMSVGHALAEEAVDTMRDRVASCWSPPAGVDPARPVSVRVILNKRGKVKGKPQVLGGYDPAVADSVRKAVLACQPYEVGERKDGTRDVVINLAAPALYNGAQPPL